MRAWQVTEHGQPRDVLRLAEVPEPVPGPGEVQLRVSAAALGLPDVLLCRGTYPLTPPLPFVPGQEVCGVVAACGEGVELARGTRLMGVTNFFDGRGGLAPLTVAMAAQCFPVPETMSDVDAAGFRIGFSTAWVGLGRRANLQAGEWLVVLGAAGGTGAAAVQLGVALGAQVIAVVSGPDKGRFCSALGAHAVVDRLGGAVVDAVLEATGGRGADVVFDPVGGGLGSSVVRALAPGGRLLSVGFASGSWARPDVGELVWRNASHLGVLPSGFGRAAEEADHEALLDLRSRGFLMDPPTVVTGGEVPEVLERIGGGTAIGKHVVDML